MNRDDATDLFRHITADKAALYRAILDVFAAARRQYRLQLRPDAVPTEADWGNLESQPDMARVSTLSDYYRARFLYRLGQPAGRPRRNPSHLPMQNSDSSTTR